MTFQKQLLSGVCLLESGLNSEENKFLWITIPDFSKCFYDDSNKNIFHKPCQEEN